MLLRRRLVRVSVGSEALRLCAFYSGDDLREGVETGAPGKAEDIHLMILIPPIRIGKQGSLEKGSFQ